MTRERMARMVASQTRHFYPTEAETAAMIRDSMGSGPVGFTLTTRGPAIVWREGKAPPPELLTLATMRGVFVENADGAGI